MKILDVSEHQPNIDYAAAAKEVDGVILRCGVTHWGTANECVADECFERHYAGFKAVGLPVGAYYYSAADNSSKVDEEVAICKKLLNGKTFELPIYYDVENPQRMEKLSKDTLTGQVIRWCDAMEDAGYFVGVYANTDYFTRKLDVDRLSKLYTIWLADYRDNFNQTIPRDMHQYTSTEKVNGISGGVDMSNLFREGIMNDISSAGLNGMKPNAPTVQLYTIVFGPCTAGDRDAAVALGNGLAINPKSNDFGIANNGNGLYLVSFDPVTIGDRNSIKQLGDRLSVKVSSDKV